MPYIIIYLTYMQCSHILSWKVKQDLRYLLNLMELEGLKDLNVEFIYSLWTEIWSSVTIFMPNYKCGFNHLENL
jgi:hypothetical protein